MRDMLERLQTINEEQEDDELEDKPKYDVDEVDLFPQTVIFDNSSEMEDILIEAQSIRKEISLIQLEIQRLSSHNERYGTSVRRFTLLKKDSDSIARGIQKRGESIYARLQALGKESSRLEEKKGPSSAVSRISRLQYDTLTLGFNAAMNDYNRAEEKQRSTCRKRIQRQASIMGTDISDKQLDVIVDKGGEGWSELSQSIQSEPVRSCHSALCEIKGRHKELVDLEARLKEVHQLFLEMAKLVEEQGSMVNNIEVNLYRTHEYVEKAGDKLKIAIQYKKKNPCLQCCPCLPFWKNS